MLTYTEKIFNFFPELGQVGFCVSSPPAVFRLSSDGLLAVLEVWMNVKDNKDKNAVGKTVMRSARMLF